MINLKAKQVETRAFPSLAETRNSLLDEMDRMVSNAKVENRSLRSDENNRFEEIKKEIEKIDKILAADVKTETREMVKASGEDVEEVRSFLQFVRTGEQRDLSSTNNGVVVPKTIANQVISKVKELAPIYARMTHFNVTGNLSIPSYSWDAHTTSFVEDFANITASGGTFLTVDLEAHAMASLALIGKNLINRTDLDVLNIIVEQIAMSIANFLNNEIINNTNTRFSGTLRSVTQSVNYTGAALTPDQLLDLQMLVPSQFQQNAVWILNPTVFGLIRRFKDTAGNYLLLNGNGSLSDDMGFRLLGKPVLLDENMPGTLAAGARSIYYGDLSGLVCNTNAPLSTQILTERYIDINAVGVITTMDLDISLAQSRALAVLVGA